MVTTYSHLGSQMAPNMRLGSGSTLSVTSGEVLLNELSQESPADLQVASSRSVQYMIILPSLRLLGCLCTSY